MFLFNIFITLVILTICTLGITAIKGCIKKKQQKEYHKELGRLQRTAHSTWVEFFKDWEYNPVLLDNGTTSFRVIDEHFDERSLKITIEDCVYSRELDWNIRCQKYSTEELKKFDWITEYILDTVKEVESEHTKHKEKQEEVQQKLLSHERIISLGDETDVREW